MKNICILILYLIIISSHSEGQIKTFSEDESIKTAMENSRDIKIAESRIAGNKAKADETSSLFLPQLKFTSGYTRLSNVGPFVIKIPFSPVPVQISDAIVNSYSFRLSLTQPLFTGNKLTSLRNSGSFAEKASEEDFIIEKNNIAANVRIAYWSFYKAKLIKKISDENVSMSELHVADTRNFMINGLATKSDLLKLEVQLSNAKLQFLEASNNLELSKITFNKTLGIPLETKSEIQVSDQEFTFASPDLKQLLNEAFINRSELKSSAYRIKSFESNVTAAKSGYYPYVYFGAGYNLANPNSRIQPQVNRFDGTWDAGIFLSWDFWNWGSTSAQVIQNEQILIQGKLSRAQLMESIELEVNQNYLNLNFLKEKAEVSNLTTGQSEENYRVIREKYNAQLATSTELADAETLLFQAKTNYANAVADYRIALIKLYKSAGRKLYP